MRKVATIVLSPWIGGLASAYDPIVLGQSPDGQQKLQVADNLVYGLTGSRKKRGGQARLNTSASVMTDGTTASTPVDGLWAIAYWYNNTISTRTEELVVVAESGRMFYNSGFGNTLTALTFSGVTPSFSHGQISGEIMNELLFIGYSRTTACLIYSGAAAVVKTATASVGTFPSGHIVRQHLNRLWIAGDNTAKDRIYYSAAEDARAFGTAGGFIDIYPGDGDPYGITAIFPSTNVRELYIAKRNSLYRLDTTDLDPANWAVIPVSRGIGCIAHNTVVSLDQADIIFCSDRGVHALQQIIRYAEILPGEYLSGDIQDQYQEILSKQLMSAVWYPELNSYLLGCRREGSDIQDTVFGYNVATKGWFRWTNVPVNFLFKRLDSSVGKNLLYACGDSSSSADSGYINELNQDNLWDFNSSTGNISMTFKSVVLYPQGDILSEKNFTNLIFLIRSRDNSSFQYEYVIDAVIKGAGTLNQRVVGGNLLGSASSYVLGPLFILGSPSGIKPLYTHIASVGAGIEVTLTHDEIGDDLEVLGMGIEFVPAEESQNAYRAFPTA